MYNSLEVANCIKKLAKEREISVGKLLEDCELNKNTLSTMTSRGSWISVESLSKIADVLNVSLDFLLGRDRAVAVSAPVGDSKQRQLLVLFAQLSDEGQDALIENAKTLLRLEEPKEKAADFV